MTFVVALNCIRYRPLFSELTAHLPVEIHFEEFEIPWEEVSARRARRPTGRSLPVAPGLREALARAEVIFGFTLPTNVVDLAPRLRWIETPATGYDQLNFTGVLESPSVCVTTVGGLFARDVAEHAFALLLALTRRLPLFFAAQGAHEWRPVPVMELTGRTLGIVGFGNIGQAVAELGRAFGMKVVATRPTRRAVPSGLVDELYDRDRLRELLRCADVVVVTVSGSETNRGLIGPAELRSMKQTSFLINVSRGIVINEEALVEALNRGAIAGAGLDVFEEEPLPASSPLWRAPNVVITPHVAIALESRMPRCIRHFADNLVRYCRGEPVIDAVKRTS
jgi:phosphoglycerate dehydrogenase-like enzyme